MANSESVEYLNQARYFVGVEQYNDALEYINKAIATDKLNKELYMSVLFQYEIPPTFWTPCSALSALQSHTFF